MSSRLPERFATGSKLLPASRTIPSIFRRRSRRCQTNHTQPSFPQPSFPSAKQITSLNAQRASRYLYAPWRRRSILKPSNNIKKQSTRTQRATFVNEVVSRLRRNQLNRTSTSTIENRLPVSHAEGAPRSSAQPRIVDAEEGRVVQEGLYEQSELS